MSDGRFIWHDLVTTDVDRAKLFYSELMNWSFETVDMPSGPYTMISVNGNTIGGFVKSDMPFSHWLTYMTSTDVDATVLKAIELGGEVMMPATDIPTVGRFAILKDPNGAMFSPIALTEEEAESDKRPGMGTFCWNENLAKDVGVAERFYTQLFNWESAQSEMDNGNDYTLIKRNAQDAGGIMKMPMPNVPSHWLGYLYTENCDEAGARAERLGGTIIVPGTDIAPHGRFVMIKDPTGAVVSLYSAPAEIKNC